MSFLSEIKARLGPLLDKLPDARDFEWVDYPHASPPKALVLGYERGAPILAFLQIRNNAKAPCVRYHINETSVDKVDVSKMNLVDPFKYFKTPRSQNSTSSRSFPVLIKYYLCVMGAELDGLTSVDEYAKGLIRAITLIQEEKRKEQDSSSLGAESNSVADDSLKLQVPAAYSDYRPLVRLLAENSDTHLLDNIPGLEGMRFSDQTAFPSALPKALFVGKREEHDIYAYISLREDKTFEIQFSYQSSRGRNCVITSDVLIWHHILHPFNKAYKQGATSIEADDELRLRSLVTWYFVTEGLFDSNTNHEIKNDPYRFYSCLSYIAKGMGPAAAEPHPPRQSADQDSENHTSPPKGKEPSCTELPSPERSSSIGVGAQPMPSPPSGEMANSHNRAVETAQYDELEKVLKQDRELTKSINRMDDMIDDLESRKQALVRKRNAMDEVRIKVKKKFRRQSLAFTSNLGIDDDDGDDDE